MKIYTGIGDHGTTNILGENGVPKDDARIEAYGGIDELNSSIGIIATYPITAKYHGELREIQNKLFTIGSVLASTKEAVLKLKLTHVGLQDIAMLESSIDKQTAELPPLKAFVLPGSCTENAICHLARTICRRAERAVVRHHHHEAVEDDILVYLNRLSDYLFTLSRTISLLKEVQDVEWKS